MKKIAIILALCGLVTIAGCGKKDENQVAEVTPTVTITPTPTPATPTPSEAIAGVEVTRTPIEGIVVTETPTPTPTPTQKPTPKPTEKPKEPEIPQQEVPTSKYVPSSGRYTNGSYYVDVVELDAGSFSFSIKDADGSTNASGTAHFKSHDSKTAVYDGDRYISFDCSGGEISISGYGFDDGGNTFWNGDGGGQAG